MNGGGGGGGGGVFTLHSNYSEVESALAATAIAPSTRMVPIGEQLLKLWSRLCCHHAGCAGEEKETLVKLAIYVAHLVT